MLFYIDNRWQSAWSKCGRKPRNLRFRPQLKNLSHCTLDGSCGRVVEIFIKTKITGAHQKKESQRTPLTVFMVCSRHFRTTGLWFTVSTFTKHQRNHVVARFDSISLIVPFLILHGLGGCHCIARPFA